MTVPRSFPRCELRDRLTRAFERRLTSSARSWFGEAHSTCGDRRALGDSYTAMARRVGKEPMAFSSEEIGELRGAGVTWPIDGWSLDELGRIVLLMTAGEIADPAVLIDLVDDCSRTGDTRERQALLRALPLLPEPDRFLAIAVDACRTSVQPVFEAIACENPYPATHFPELNFNQMVLKALFTGVALARIVGLDGRRTHELARMASDYASERRAAGRSVPPDIDRLLQGETCS